MMISHPAIIPNQYNLGRVCLGLVRNKNNSNNVSKRFSGSYSHSGPSNNVVESAAFVMTTANG